ncbi:MAG TPA: hypothetical protein EYG79_05570 [Rhodobacteraceae bacterium]|nr:hypothetical protein [Paracoccaceae bacterium]
MVYFKDLEPRNVLILAAAMAFVSVSGCTTTTGPTAGAPSSHTPQNYESLTSTASTTSTLGGSAILARVDIATDSLLGATAVATTGSTNHSTGRIALNDGTYLFIDADGPDAFGHMADGHGATGELGTETFITDLGTYDYVTPYRVSYISGGERIVSVGVAGMITASSDMPIAGSASYSGAAEVQLLNNDSANYANDLYLDNGISAVSVDFAAGTADVTLGSFAVIADGIGNAITAATASFDELQGTGLLISGSHFTGGSWVTVSQGVVVSVVGAGETATSNGSFFGYDPSISAPDEVGGVVFIDGGTATVFGVYLAD